MLQVEQDVRGVHNKKIKVDLLIIKAQAEEAAAEKMCQSRWENSSWEMARYAEPQVGRRHKYSSLQEVLKRQ